VESGFLLWLLGRVVRWGGCCPGCSMADVGWCGCCHAVVGLLRPNVGEGKSKWKKGARRVWSSRYNCCAVLGLGLFCCCVREAMWCWVPSVPAAPQWVAVVFPTSPTQKSWHCCAVGVDKWSKIIYCTVLVVSPTSVNSGARAQMPRFNTKSRASPLLTAFQFWRSAHTPRFNTKSRSLHCKIMARRTQGFDRRLCTKLTTCHIKSQRQHQSLTCLAVCLLASSFLFSQTHSIGNCGFSCCWLLTVASLVVACCLMGANLMSTHHYLVSLSADGIISLWFLLALMSCKVSVF
jgi:hypothetical protein